MSDNTVILSSNTSSQKSPEKHTLYLFSLPASNLLEQTITTTTTTTPTPTTPTTTAASSIPVAQQQPPKNAHAALLVRRLWEWKDDALGDGRDFFVPRPKTLAALNQVLRQQLQATECVVLSNCARFDVLLVVPNLESKNSINNGPDAKISNGMSQEEITRQTLAYALLQQYAYDKEQNQKAKSLFALPSSLFDGGDQPQRLCLDPPLPPTPPSVVSSRDSIDTTTVNNDRIPSSSPPPIIIDPFDVKTVATSLQYLQGPETIARYLCRVATGLQAQGRRPDRQVVFRPFSSRDAHVMLQLKRTADIAASSAKQQQQFTTSNTNNISGAQPRLKALLDLALQSGKAARDPNLVPAILPLKKYGSGGSSSRYSLGDAPGDVSEEAARQASETAIEPMVAKYVQKWTALELSEQIQSFRYAVESSVEESLGIRDLETSIKAKPIRALLHPHIMAIREGGCVDIDAVLQEISDLNL